MFAFCFTSETSGQRGRPKNTFSSHPFGTYSELSTINHDILKFYSFFRYTYTSIRSAHEILLQKIVKEIKRIFFSEGRITQEKASCHPPVTCHYFKRSDSPIFGPVKRRPTCIRRTSYRGSFIPALERAGFPIGQQISILAYTKIKRIQSS